MADTPFKETLPRATMPNPLTVSDHAALRWLQRSGLIDVDFFRATLATALSRASTASAAIGATEYLIVADGLVFVVRDSVVVTVLDDHGRHQQARALGHGAQGKGYD